MEHFFTRDLAHFACSGVDSANHQVLRSRLVTHKKSLVLSETPEGHGEARSDSNSTVQVGRKVESVFRVQPTDCSDTTHTLANAAAIHEGQSWERTFSTRNNIWKREHCAHLLLGVFVLLRRGKEYLSQ